MISTTEVMKAARDYYNSTFDTCPMIQLGDAIAIAQVYAVEEGREWTMNDVQEIQISGCCGRVECDRFDNDDHCQHCELGE